MDPSKKKKWYALAYSKMHPRRKLVSSKERLIFQEVSKGSYELTMCVIHSVLLRYMRTISQQSFALSFVKSGAENFFPVHRRVIVSKEKKRDRVEIVEITEGPPWYVP